VLWNQLPLKRNCVFADRPSEGSRAASRIDVMGFFDFLKGAAVKCPLCGAPNARKSGARVVCPNPLCRNSAEPQQAAAGAGGDSTAPAKPTKVPRGRWQPQQPL